MIFAGRENVDACLPATEISKALARIPKEPAASGLNGVQ
jgi:hypothetical protein